MSGGQGAPGCPEGAKIPGSTTPWSLLSASMSSSSSVTLIQQWLKRHRDLRCCKQTVYRVSESAFSSFFRQANGGKGVL